MKGRTMVRIAGLISAAALVSLGLSRCGDANNLTEPTYRSVLVAGGLMVVMASPSWLRVGRESLAPHAHKAAADKKRSEPDNQAPIPWQGQ